LDSDVRGKRHASKNGILRGVKPADNVPNIWSQPERSATPAIYADERNLCLKRRENREVKVAETLRPKGQGCGPHLLSLEVRDYPRWLFLLNEWQKGDHTRPAYRRQLRIAGTRSCGTEEL
jgi:hypothetical protein